MLFGRKEVKMLIDKIKALSNAVSQEQYLVEFIEKNSRLIIGMSIHDLAKASLTSTGTITRLCKKIGMKGYSDFKYKFASELPTIIELGEDLKITSFDRKSNVQDVLEKMELVHKRSISYTRGLIDKSEILEVEKLIKETDRIEIYGEGLNFELAKVFQLNLEEFGVQCGVYNSLNPMHISFMEKENVNALAIILTHTGKNPHMLEIAEKLKESRCRILVICDSKEREISKLCNQTIVIMTTRNGLDLGNFVYPASLMYLFDVFASIKLLVNYDEIEQITNRVELKKEE